MSTSKDFIFFPQDSISYSEKFYFLMDLLVSNQQSTQTEAFLLFAIYYIQFISGFFCDQVGVFNISQSTSDMLLNYIYKIFRLKDLFRNSYSDYKIIIYILVAFFFIYSIYFIVKISKMDKATFYSLSEAILNYGIKIFIYILFNITLDMTLSNFCFESSSGTNPNFSDISCTFFGDTVIRVLCIILLIYIIFCIFFIQLFYNDSLYLSNSPYSKISCNYEIYMALNSIVYSILLIHVKSLSKEVFLIYNLIISALFVNFYFRRFLFYARITNILCGLFHILYLWTSFFFLIFAYVDFNEKGIIYIVSSLIVLYFYFNLKYKIEENILLATPFYKITNKYYLLYYIKNIIDKINNMTSSPEEKALLTGIVQMHAIECPNPECLSKTKKKIYLPMTNEWSDRSKPLINDQVFLFNFVIVVMNFFIEQNYYSPDMIINMSLYYLEIIGNFCLSLFFYKKAKEMKLTHQEKFSFIRLHIAISKSLVAKLKPANEPCLHIEDLNMTLYFKYTDLSQKLFDEMSHDVNFLLEFWKSFKGSQTDSSKSIDFNKIFHLTDKIRITKAKVVLIWSKLFDIYNGVNDLFDLYLNYTEQINDDDLLKRDLEEIKRKAENNNEFIQQNYYNILFNKETGIIIANGDKGKEGIIERANYSIEEIFKYKAEELKGMSINQLMPRLLAKDHKHFMEKFNEYGEKKIIDNKEMKTFGKDKNNSLILIRIGVKLFPMINQNVFFGSMIVKENIDDIIFIDSKFIIQGMSMKLMKILQIDNNSLFNDNDIPFYVICREFVNFYNIFLRKKHNTKDKSKIQATSLIDDNISSNSINGNTNNNVSNINGETIINKTGDYNNKEGNNHANEEDDSPENIEINENIELEYEIRVPQFIYDYANYQNKKEKKIEMNLSRKDTESYNNNNISMNEQIEEYAESDLLVANDDITPGVGVDGMSPKKEQLNSPGKEGIMKQMTVFSKEDRRKLDENQNEFNHQADEEKEFTGQIQKARDLFENNLFTELVSTIDKANKDNSIKEFKFNFTFDRYIYGEKQKAYIVRCIDNKVDGAKSDEESLGEENDPKIGKFRKEKNESMKLHYEIFDDEKKVLIENYQKFIQFSLEDRSFQKILGDSKETIYKMSMVHGQKQQEITEDENASQTSQSSYKDSLCQKNHIEEIKENIMKNVSNFYTLKYIKILLVAMFITTSIFMACLMVFTFKTNNNLTKVADISKGLYQSTVWMSDLESTLISLRTLYRMRRDHQQYNFATFIDGEDAYFTKMKNGYARQWYNDIIKNFGLIEADIGAYIKDSMNTFWNNEPVLYDSDVKTDDEAFPFLLAQILSDINSLLTDKNYTNQETILDTVTDLQHEFFEYSAFLSIENTVSNLLPSQYNKIKTLPIELKNFNKKQMNNIILLIVINFVVIFLLNVVYTILLYLTNKNMGEGLEKVTKIRTDKIEETIKKIELFNLLLKKHQEKGSKLVISDNLNDKQLGKDGLNEKQNNSSNNSEYSGEIKKHKKLNILNHSYLHTLIILAIEAAFLIPLYLITYQMIDNTNQMINVQGYMFGKIILAAASTIDVKCMMSECANTSAIEYTTLVNKSDIQSIVQGISIFPELSDFYNNKFLLNACDSAFDKVANATEYQACMTDVLIQSANNTDSLLKLVEETVDNIIKEKEMKEDKDVTYPNNTVAPFKKILLYDTTSFKELETVFYKYIAPVSDNFSLIAANSLANYLEAKLILICILGAVLAVLILAFSIYIGVFFVNQLIHLLSVSRCILKIIPTTIIIITKELQVWIENKY